MGQKLEKLYENILSFASMKPNDEGEILINYVFDDEEKSQVHVEGRGLVMPTEKQLRAYHPEKTMIFHPLQEFVNRGESEVVKALRHQINVRMNYTTLVVASSLLTLVSSPALHKNLSPEQRELLLEVKGGDAGLPARFMDFATKRFANATSRFFCNIYLKKAGTFEGQKHARVGVVQFPFYDLFDGTEEIKLKKGDEEVFVSVLKFIFPGSDDDKEAYNNFSDHRDAPWLDCLLKTSFNLAERLNELLTLYKPFIDDADSFFFNDEWVEPMDNIEQYRDEIRRIPSQKGNEGTVEVDGKETSTVAKLPEATRVVPAPAERMVPTELPRPAAVSRQYPTPSQYPPEQLIYDAYGRCLNSPPPPPQLPHAYEGAPAEDGKVDFRTLKANNPMVQAAAMIATPISEWQNQQNMRAMPQNPYYDPRLAGPQYAPQVNAWGQPMGGQPYVDPRFAQVDPRFMQQPQFDQWGRPIVDPRFAQQMPYNRINNNV